MYSPWYFVNHEVFYNSQIAQNQTTRRERMPVRVR